MRLHGVRDWAEHRWARRRLHDYVDGDLANRFNHRVERHARRCAECGPLLRALVGLVGALRELRRAPAAPVTPAVIERLRRDAEADADRSPERRRP